MITLKGLRKRFGRRDILQGIDLQVERGHRIALIGSNGAGKTTLIRCLLGEYVHEGEVLIDGVDPRRDRTGVLGQIGFVPQLPPPLKMPVGQLVNYVARVCHADPEAIVGVARRLGFEVPQFRHQPFVRLSGGQKQKLLIAAALGRRANILILDEPAANLDPEARAIFFDLLAERQSSAAMLISSHRLDEVASLVNRVIELDQGKVVLDDLVADNIDLGSRMHGRVRLTRPEPAFGKAIAAWGFTSDERGLIWHGDVAGADRLRFLGTVSRYAGLIAELKLEDSQAASDREPRKISHA